MKDIVEIHEFFYQGTDSENSHVLLHISEPSEDEEKGYFFALCDIENSNPDMVSHIQQLIDDLESGYYETDDTAKKHAFEATIEYINRRSHHILEHKGPKIHMVVGVIEDQDILFTGRGDMDVHLLYRKGGDLIKVNVNEEKKFPKDQLFSSVVEGEIRTDDFLVITSNQVEHFFPLNRTLKLLTQKNTKASALHIQKTLEHIDSERSLGGILLHRPKEEDKPKLKKLPKVAKTIHKSEPEEKESPTFFSSVAGQLAKKFDKSPIEATIFNPQPKPVVEQHEPQHSGQKTSLPPAMAALGKGIGIVLFSIINVVQGFFRFLFRFFSFLFILLTNHKNQREKSIHNIKISFKDFVLRMKTLPLLSKILLFLAIVAVSAFVGSILLFQHRETEKIQTEDYTQKVAAIESKKDAAESTLIYGDSQKALTYLQEAQAILGELQNHPKKDVAQVELLKNQVQEALTTIRKQGEVPSEVKYDITDTAQNAATQKLILVDNTLVAFGPTDNTSYFINLDTGAIDPKNHDAIGNLNIAAIPKEADIIVFTSGDNQIAQYDRETEGLSLQNIAYPNGDTVLADLALYNRRLYTLDKTHGQIYRHNPTLTGYDKGTNWITSGNFDFSDAQSIAIDGDIFVLKGNGTILKFTSGAPSPFEIQGLDPVLQSPTRLITGSDMTRIYILEPSQKRIITLNKNGQLQKQYTSSEWNQPSDIAVDEARGIMYLLDSNKIFEIKI